MNDDFPSSKIDRGKIFAKTGLKLGTNYAKRYLKKKTGKTESESEKRLFYTENARQVFNEFTKLRGTALKMAQSLSMDQGVLPEEFTDVMSEAQYSVPPINKALVRSIIKKELGEYPEQLFKSYTTDAIAAASIGQVHKAVLKDGSVAAIKIQYPNVRNTIQSDLALAKTLLKRFTKKGANLDAYFDEIEETLLEETDYNQEAEYLKYYHKRYSHGDIITPIFFEEYSTQKILAMGFLDGVHLKEFLKNEPPQERRNHFGQLLWDFFHLQVEQRSFIHADAHPGNFLFREDGKLGVIDFGCVKNFPESFTRRYMQLLPSHLKNDEHEIRDLFIDLGIIRETPDNPEKEERFYEFCKNYGEIFAQPYTHNQFDFGDQQYRDRLNKFSRTMPIMNEPRGDKNFIFSTKVHLGLYGLLMKLGAVVDTTKSIELTHRMVDEMTL